MPWALESDGIAVRELAKLLLRGERLDSHLSRVGDLTAESDDAKRLVSERRQLSAAILAWCRELGLTPASRAALGLSVARGRVLDLATAMSAPEAGE